MFRYQIEVNRRVDGCAVVGLFAGKYEQADRASHALFRAYPGQAVSIFDQDNIDPPEYLVRHVRAVSLVGARRFGAEVRARLDTDARGSR